ncbi:MAG: hypothetical protein ABI946_03565, partial [Chthoniobacterales bacterium]
TTITFQLESTVFFIAGPGGFLAQTVSFDHFASSSPFDITSAGEILLRGIIGVDNMTAGTSFRASELVITQTLAAGTFIDAAGDLTAFSSIVAGDTINVGGRLSSPFVQAGGNVTAGTVSVLNLNAPTGILTAGSGGIIAFVTDQGAALEHIFNVASIVSPNGIDFSGNQFNGAGGIFSGGRLTLNVDSIRFDGEVGVGTANFNGADGLGNQNNPPNRGGGDGGVFIVNATGNIFVGENISATTGLNDPDGGPGASGAGGQVTLDSSSGAVAVNSTILVSSNDRIAVAAPGGGTPAPVRASASGGNITVHSGLTTGTAVNLSNTSHLLSYLADFAPGPGGTISITSNGGDIFANGEIIADRGTIIISNVGPGGRPSGLIPNPLISLTGSFVRLRAETLDITSAGDIELGISGEFVDLGSVTISISAANDITGGFVFSGGGKGGPVFALDSDGNFSLAAQGAITLDGLTAARENSGRTNGINLTVEAGTSLSLGSLDLNTVNFTDGLASGGDITVRSGTDAQIDFVYLQTDAAANTGSGGNILFQSGGNLNTGGFSSAAFVEAPLGSGANVTLNVGGNAVFDDGNGGGYLDLSVAVFNAGTLNTGGNVMATFGGDLTAYSLSARVDGYDAITTGGNISLNIIGNLVVGAGDALFRILAQAPIAVNGRGPGPTLNVSAANINVDGNLIAYIDESGSGAPSGQTAGSVLIQSAGTINLPFGVLEVLGTVNAGGDINAFTLASTNVNSNTKIAAGSGGIRRFAVPGGLPVELLHTLSAPSITSQGGINFDGLAADGDFSTATAGGALTINANSINFGTGIVGPVTLNGGDGSGVPGFEGSDGGILTVNTTGGITVNSAIEATTGFNQGASPSGAGGTVTLNSTAATVAVNSRIEVSSAPDPSPTPGPHRHSNAGGNININSGAAGGATNRAVAVNISSSSQLLALLDAASTGPGGKITIRATGAQSDVNVAGRTEATRGTIDIRHQGDDGNVNIGPNFAGNNPAGLPPTTLSADVIKANAFGANGQLNIGNSTLSGQTLIRLYAEGSNGQLNFVSNTILSSSNRIDLAAGTITIQPSVVVTITGSAGAANIYTNNPNYSGPGGVNPANGRFGGNGANLPLPFDSRPGFDDPPPARPPIVPNAGHPGN